MSLDASAVVGIVGGALGVGGLVFGAGRVHAQNQATTHIAEKLERSVEKLAKAVTRIEALCPQCRKSGKHNSTEDSQEE